MPLDSSKNYTITSKLSTNRIHFDYFSLSLSSLLFRIAWKPSTPFASYRTTTTTRKPRAHQPEHSPSFCRRNLTGGLNRAPGSAHSMEFLRGIYAFMQVSRSSVSEPSSKRTNFCRYRGACVFRARICGGSGSRHVPPAIRYHFTVWFRPHRFFVHCAWKWLIFIGLVHFVFLLFFCFCFRLFCVSWFGTLFVANRHLFFVMLQLIWILFFPSLLSYMLSDPSHTHTPCLCISSFVLCNSVNYAPCSTHTHTTTTATTPSIALVFARANNDKMPMHSKYFCRKLSKNVQSKRSIGIVWMIVRRTVVKTMTVMWILKQQQQPLFLIRKQHKTSYKIHSQFSQSATFCV